MVWVVVSLHIVTSWAKEVIAIFYITLSFSVDYVLYVFLQKEHRASL